MSVLETSDLQRTPHNNRMRGQSTDLFSIGGDMKAKTIVLTLALCFVTTAVCFAGGVPQKPVNPAMMGTWQLDEAKSKIAPGAPKNTTVVYEAAGDKVKITVDGIDGNGQVAHNEWTGKFDNQAYPVTGDPAADSRTYRRANYNTLAFANKKGGKVTLTGRVVVSADGKTRTVTTSATDAQGKIVKSTAVYNKQ
jgi:hypothetical protein